MKNHVTLILDCVITKLTLELFLFRISGIEQYDIFLKLFNCN